MFFFLLSLFFFRFYLVSVFGFGLFRFLVCGESGEGGGESSSQGFGFRFSDRTASSRCS